MTSAQTALFAVFILFLLFCGPPLLCLWLCVLRVRRLVRNGRNGRLFGAGIALSVATFLFNTAIVFLTFFAFMSDQKPFSGFHVVAGALSWLCLWLWIAMLFIRPRILRRPHT